MNKPLLLITTLLCFGLSLSSFAQSKIDFIEKLAPSDRLANDQFGWNMDSDSTFLVAGVPNCTYWDNNETVDFSGAVYSYKIEGEKLVFHQKVFAPFPKKESSFGVAVALHKDVLVVGSQRYRSSTQSRYQTKGGIYIYRLIEDKWEFEQFFVNPNKANKNNGRFGEQLAIYGNYILAGDGSFNSSVSLFKYENEKWRITDTIIEKDTTFGKDAAIFEKTVVIGSKNFTNPDGTVNQIGKIYIYSIDEYDKLKLQKTHRPNLKKNSDRGFGSRISIYDDYLLVGAETSDPLHKSGALYVYNFDPKNYSLELDTMLKADQPLKGDWFGYAFDLEKNILAVGAMGNTKHETVNDEYLGSVYFYEKIDKKWKFKGKVYSINPQRYDKFGFSISILNSNIFIGCRLDDEDENEKYYTKNAGSIYQYKVVKK